ncbi:MAG: ABC transporter permease subunit [Candidatus Dormibacteria bacterium]
MSILSSVLVWLVLALPLVGAFAMFAVGIVVIYRASRVLNLAHGAMAMVPAFLVYQMVAGHTPALLAAVAGVALGSLVAGPVRRDLESRLPLPEARWHLALAGGLAAGAVTGWLGYRLALALPPLPLLIAFPAGIAAGALLGYLVELLVVRRLRVQGPTAQTVGTVAALSLLIEVSAKIWGTAGLVEPPIFPVGAFKVGLSQIKYGEVGLFAVAVLAAAVMVALFRFTDLGLALRAAAENRRGAALVGIDPDRAASMSWAMGGALAALAGILLAAVTLLHPYTLPLQVLPGFVAALIGGLASLPLALAGSVLVGTTFGLPSLLGSLPPIDLGPIHFDIAQASQTQGLRELFLTIVALGVMASRGARFSGAERGDDPVGAARAVDDAARSRKMRSPGVAWARRLVFVALGIALFAWPFIIDKRYYSFVVDGTNAATFAIIAVSLVLLTGWVGQISLAQASLVGVGAFTTALASIKLHIPFPLTSILSMAAAAAIATVLGLVALRVRGLFLAVATLIFAWMSYEYLFQQTWFVIDTGGPTIRGEHVGQIGALNFFDLTDARVIYVISVAAALLALLVADNLRSSRTGRAFFAVRGSEMAAASLGMDVTRYRLLAFALSGMLAGLAGNLIIIGQRTVVPTTFSFNLSLFYLGIVVVGGLGSLGGAVAASVLFAALNEVFFQVPALNGYLPIVSAGLLMGVLMLYPGGLAALGAGARRLARPLTDRVMLTLERPASAMGARMGARLRDFRVPWRERELGEGAPAAPEPSAPPRPEPQEHAAGRIEGLRPVLSAAPPASREDLPALAEAEGVTVQFGGLVAVNNVSLSVRQGEIVGLIGPNGAGKTVTFNSLVGFVVPTQGRVRLFGQDVSDWPVHERAALGVARTFQVLQLFSELTVFDNLLAATHLHNRSGVVSHLAATESSLHAERLARARVRKIMRLLDLESIADRPIAGLPFGVQRTIEVARALVTEAPLVLLDEATSGLDSRETDALADVLLEVRRDLGITVLFIEHDVELVVRLCDYIYVLDRGNLLAEGRPAEVQRHPAVIAAYLGEPVEVA